MPRYRKQSSKYALTFCIAGRGTPTERLLLFEPLARELQGVAVLRDDAHDVVGDAGGGDDFDLQGHAHPGAEQAREVRKDLVGDFACVAADTVTICWPARRPRYRPAASS